MISSETFLVVGIALLGALISYLSLIVTKENGISTFRQAWIDALREDLAEFVGAASMVASIRGLMKESMIRPDGTPMTPKEIEGLNMRMSEAQERVVELTSRISLRLNPQKHADLLQCVQSFLENVSAKQNHGQKQIGDVDKELLTKSQAVLKKEWERVKEGESTYKKTKSFAKASMIVLASVFVIAILSNLCTAADTTFSDKTRCNSHPCAD